MIEITNTEVFGWAAAIRGMRNPKNSWEKSDSYAGRYIYMIGENDEKLMKSLVEAGSDHSKFMRMIHVQCDIVAPMYWWKEYDTYKVGTVRNSCSTMHKIASKEFSRDDFSHDKLTVASVSTLETTIERLNYARNQFNNGNKNRSEYVPTSEEYWWDMIQLLPSSYNQRATIDLNYAVLRNIYHARRNHKLTEWLVFCDWIHSLPYSSLITRSARATAQKEG